MSDMFRYKDYFGTIEYSAQDNCLFGKILGITDLFIYEGTTIDELKKNFEDMVDAYLDDCKKKNIQPQKAYKGSFNVRVSPELHREAALFSLKNGITLNRLVEQSLKTFLANQAGMTTPLFASEKSALSDY